MYPAALLLLLLNLYPSPYYAHYKIRFVVFVIFLTAKEVDHTVQKHKLAQLLTDVTLMLPW